MRLLVHDLGEEEFDRLEIEKKDTIILSSTMPIHHCIGCFGCWVKTPGKCMIRDFYGDMGEYLSNCDTVIILSKCCYGGFSPFIKNVLDRSIPYLHPYFEIKNGEMHHKMRYDNRFALSVWFYGEDITASEEWTAHNLVRANALNLGCNVETVQFVKRSGQMKGRIK